MKSVCFVLCKITLVFSSISIAATAADSLFKKEELNMENVSRRKGANKEEKKYDKKTMI